MFDGFPQQGNTLESLRGIVEGWGVGVGEGFGGGSKNWTPIVICKNHGSMLFQRCPQDLNLGCSLPHLQTSGKVQIEWRSTLVLSDNENETTNERDGFLLLRVGSPRDPNFDTHMFSFREAMTT